MVEPVLIPDISAVELDVDGPFPPGEPPLSGSPIASGREMSDDGHVQTGVWECTPGSFRWATDGTCELMHFIAGDATMTADDGSSHYLTAGVVLFVPDGWSGTWDIRTTVRKSYTIVRTR